MTDRFPDSEPDFNPDTFRADLPGEPSRLLGALKAVAAVVACLALVLGGGFAFVQVAYLSGLPKVPGADALWSLNRAPGILFLDKNGARLAARGPRHGQGAQLAQLPAYVPKAFLAAEDRRFYQHGPVDWRGVARAALADLRAGQVVQGGSTLTQQLAKTLFLSPEQTLKRKVQEAVLAYRLAGLLTKDQILELYLNRVFFGANAYGIDAAARTYFGKPAAALTLSEAALLAALPRAPSRLSPASDMPAALARSRAVLRRMASSGWITAAQERAALAAPPALVAEPPEDEDFGYLLDYAQAEATRLAGGKAPDLVVRLTVDPGLQTTASAVARRVIQDQGTKAGAREAALVALGPDGAIRALVGGVDHRFSAFNRATQARRQPGSAFKPFVYAAALEAGVRPDDVRRDAPLTLGAWSPANYGGGYAGDVTVKDALARSINTVAVRLAKEAGTDRIGDLAWRFGLTGVPGRPGLSVALGAYEETLLEMTSAMQVFQQDGRRSEPYLISSIATSSGAVLYQRPASPPRQVYDPGLSGQMTALLKGAIDHGTGRRAALDRPAAGKTGTSQAWRDAWFVGFTPDWVCGVWVGNDDGTPMDKVAGGDLPADIWRRFMLVAHQGLPARDFGGVAPESAQTPADDRASFYRDLAAQFHATAQNSAQPEPAP